MLKPLKIGVLVEEDRKANRNKSKATNVTDKNIGENGIKKQKTCFKIFFCK